MCRIRVFTRTLFYWSCVQVLCSGFPPVPPVLLLLTVIQGSPDVSHHLHHLQLVPHSSFHPIQLSANRSLSDHRHGCLRIRSALFCFLRCSEGSRFCPLIRIFERAFKEITCTPKIKSLLFQFEKSTSELFRASLAEPVLKHLYKLTMLG